MRRQRARVEPRQYCVHSATNGRLPCARFGEPHQVCEPIGPYAPMTLADAQRIAGGGLTWNTPAELRAAIVDRMVRWGEPLWHACARVAGTRCSCAACINPADPRHPWLIADYSEAA